MNRVISIFLRHWKSLLVLNLIVFGVAAFKIKLSPKTWSSNAQLIMPSNNDNLNANLGTLGSLNGSNTTFLPTVNPLIAQQSILTSNIVMETVLAKDPEKADFPRVNRYKNLFEVEIVDQSTTFNLSVIGSSPELALERANNWIEAYQQRLNELRKQKSIAHVDFNQQELTKAKQNLDRAQQKLAQFEESSGLVSYEEQTTGIVELIDQLTAAKYQAEVKMKANEQKVIALSTRLELNPTQAIQSVSLSENQDYQAVKTKLQQVEITLHQLLTSRTEADPRVQNLRLQQKKLQNQLQQYVQQTAGASKVDITVANNSGRTALIQQLIAAETEADAQRLEAEKLDNKIHQLQASLKVMPNSKINLQKLQKEKDIAEGVYQGLIAKIQQTKIDAFNAYPQVQVVEPPTMDSKPVSPHIMLIQLNALLASIVGSTTIILWLERRNPLLNVEDLNTCDFPIVGHIRQLKHFGRLLQDKELRSNLIFQPNMELELDFQRLASTISLQPIENRRLLVTSAMSGEGKTTVTIGLAKALVDLGFRVLMVDADFHKAELSNSLADMKLNTCPDQPLELIPNLYLQTVKSQQPNTAALIRQGRFERGLQLAESVDHYDYLIIDSAPLCLTSETALMAGAISNILFVVRPNVSERNLVHSGFEQLNQHHANILGLVVNGIETTSPAHHNNTYRSLEAVQS